MLDPSLSRVKAQTVALSQTWVQFLDSALDFDENHSNAVDFRGSIEKCRSKSTIFRWLGSSPRTSTTAPVEGETPLHVIAKSGSLDENISKSRRCDAGIEEMMGLFRLFDFRKASWLHPANPTTVFASGRNFWITRLVDARFV